MIIVEGKLYITSGKRDLFIEKSMHAMRTARQTKGCFDFVVAADPIELDRVNIFEKWESEKELTAFRGSGPNDELSSLISKAAVNQHVVDVDDD